MVALPRECGHCGKKLMHYGACNCPAATIDWVKVERAAITARLARLDKIEDEARTQMVDR